MPYPPGRPLEERRRACAERRARRAAGRRAPGRRGRHAVREPYVTALIQALQRPHKRIWQAVISVLGVCALLSVCGLSSYFIVADERQGRGARASSVAAPTAVPRDISSRTSDPEPLTVAEVFPGDAIIVDPAQPPYRVLRTQASRDCRAAASGRIGRLLRDLGCSQVVRGTLRSPAGGYLITAGVLNLAELEGAEWAHERIAPLVDGGLGRFEGLVAGPHTAAIALSSARVGWHVRGHYLVYCVIARADRKPIRNGDAHAERILTDLLERHLHSTVLERRTTS
ncbi:hypothetical protein WEI85_22875 [Actinomycetes bacterium KLBMP 9797]